MGGQLGATGYLRRQSAYAFNNVTLAMLSSEDLAQLRKERSDIDKHLRPFVTHVKRNRHLNNIDQVFAAMDLDGDGWIDREEFRLAVENRKVNNLTPDVAIRVRMLDIVFLMNPFPRSSEGSMEEMMRSHFSTQCEHFKARGSPRMQLAMTYVCAVLVTNQSRPNLSMIHIEISLYKMLERGN